MGRSGGRQSGATPARQPVRIVRGPGEHDLTISYPDKTITAVGRIETPQNATEPHINPDGELYSSAPLVLAFLDSGTVVDENGAATLEPGVYLIHGDAFEKGEPVEHEPQPKPETVCPEITLDEWEDEVFLEAARAVYRRSDDDSLVIRPGELAYRMQSDRFHEQRDRFGDEIWDHEFSRELEHQIAETLSKLAKAGCFYEYADQYGNRDFVFTDAGWLLSDRLHGR